MRRDHYRQYRQRSAGEALPPLPPLQRADRPALTEMSAPDLIAWLTEQQAELESFCAYAHNWRESRHRRGLHTSNDDRYDQFLPRGIDLAAGLAEWRAALEASEQEENQSGGQS
jgi:hypothetical protein